MPNNVVKTYNAFRVNENLLFKVLEAVKKGEVDARRYGQVRSFEVSYHGHRQDLVLGTVYLVPAKLADNAEDFPSALLYGQVVKELTPEVVADLYHQKIGESEFDTYNDVDMRDIKDRLFKDDEGRYRTLVCFLPAWTTPKDLVVFKYVRKDDLLLQMLRHVIYNVYYDPRLSSGFDALSSNAADLNVNDITPKFNFPNLAEGQEQDFPVLQSWLTGKTAGAKRAKTVLSADSVQEEFLEPGEKAVLNALERDLATRVDTKEPSELEKQAGKTAAQLGWNVWTDNGEVHWQVTSKSFAQPEKVVAAGTAQTEDQANELVKAKLQSLGAFKEKEFSNRLIAADAATGLRVRPDYGEEGSYTSDANEFAEAEARANGKSAGITEHSPINARIPKQPLEFDEILYKHFDPMEATEEDAAEPEYYSIVLFNKGKGTWSGLVTPDRVSTVVGQSSAEQIQEGAGKEVGEPDGSPYWTRLTKLPKTLNEQDEKLLQGEKETAPENVPAFDADDNKFLQSMGIRAHKAYAVGRKTAASKIADELADDDAGLAAEPAAGSEDALLADEAEQDPSLKAPKTDLVDSVATDAAGVPPADAPIVADVQNAAPIDPMLPSAAAGAPMMNDSGQWKDRELELIGDIADKANPEKATWSEDGMREEIRHAIDIIDTVRDHDNGGAPAMDAAVSGVPIADAGIVSVDPIAGAPADPLAQPVDVPPPAVEQPIVASKRKVLAKDNAFLVEVKKAGKVMHVAVSREGHVEKVAVHKGKVAFAEPHLFPGSFRIAATKFLLAKIQPKKADVPLTTDEIFREITEEIGPAPQVPTPGDGSPSTPAAPAGPAHAKGESGNGSSPKEPVSTDAEQGESGEKPNDRTADKPNDATGKRDGQTRLERLRERRGEDENGKPNLEEYKTAAFNLFVPGQVLEAFRPELMHSEVDYSNDPHADLNPLELDRALDAQPDGGYISTDPVGGLMGVGDFGKQQVLEGAPLRGENDIRGYGFSDEFYSQYEGIDPKAFIASTDVLKNIKKKAAPSDYVEQFADFMKKAIGEVAATFIAAFKATQRATMSQVPGTGSIKFDLMEEGLLANVSNQVDVASRLRFLVGKLTDSQIQSALNDAWAQSAVWNTTENGGYTYEVFCRAEKLDQESLVLTYSFVTGTKGL